MNKNLAIILLSVTVGILLIFLLLPDKQHDTHAAENANLKIQNERLIADAAASKKKDDSLNLNIRQQDTVIKDLIGGQYQTRQELDKSKTLAQRYASEIREYNKDTGVYGRKMDSLVNEVDKLVYLLNQYEAYADSLNSINDKQKADYQALLSERARLNTELRNSYDKVYKEYQTVFNENKSMKKSLKREKLKTRIAAVLGLVAAGIMILK